MWSADQITDRSALLIIKQLPIKDSLNRSDTDSKTEAEQTFKVSGLFSVYKLKAESLLLSV